MSTYIVRPYFGHDCNSWDGFNNGHYLDSIEVMAETEEQAIEIVMRKFKTENTKIAIKADDYDLSDEFGENIIAWVVNYTDRYGNEITTEQFQESDCFEAGYLYQYIDFNDVELTDRNTELELELAGNE